MLKTLHSAYGWREPPRSWLRGSSPFERIPTVIDHQAGVSSTCSCAPRVIRQCRSLVQQKPTCACRVTQVPAAVRLEAQVPAPVCLQPSCPRCKILRLLRAHQTCSRRLRIHLLPGCRPWEPWEGQMTPCSVPLACMEVLQPACQNRKHQPLLSLAALQEQRQPVYLDLWM